MPLAPLPPQHLLHPDATSPGGCRFILERQLSAGGFAITYLAWDQQFRDRCVIKELAIDQLMSRSGLAMLPLPGRADEVASWLDKAQEEAVTLHRLRNAGVVPVRATWRENGTAYFAMDFIDGIELPAQPMQGVTWSTWEPVARKLLTALGAIHEAGLIHGDIKPENVLVTREGRPVVIDFGTARTSGEARTSRLATAAMTPGYCPPELAVRNRADELGPWSDLYSWAITVMGLAVRHQGVDGRPLDANARVALALHGIADGGLGASTASALHEAGLSSEWVAALMSCVALDPKKRPASVEALLARLDALSEPKTAELRVSDALWPIVPTASPLSLLEEVAAPAVPAGMRTSQKWGLATSVALLLALAAGAAFWPTTRSSTAADSSGVAAKSPEPSPSPSATDAGNPPDAAAQPTPVPATSPSATDAGNPPDATAQPSPVPSTSPATPPAAPTPPAEPPAPSPPGSTAPPATTRGPAPAAPPGMPPASAPAKARTKPNPAQPSVSAPQSSTTDSRTRIARAKAAYSKSDDAFTDDLGNIIGIHNDLRCEPNLSCGRYTCDDLADKAIAVAASVRTIFQDIDRSLPTAEVADQAEAALARHRRAREDMSRAETRFRESCWQPDSYDEE